jgi:ABC-type lipoprotein release transport system permease subunit
VIRARVVTRAGAADLACAGSRAPLVIRARVVTRAGAADLACAGSRAPFVIRARVVARATAVTAALIAVAVAWGAPPPSPAVIDIAVSDRTARALGVGPGDIVELGTTAAGPWRRVRVARVYRPLLYPTDVADRDADIRLHLPDLQALSGDAAGDQVDSIVVRLRDPSRAAAVAGELNSMGLGVRAYTSADLARRNSSSFEVVARFHRAIGAVAVLAGSVFLVTIMILRGEEMRRETGMMRLMGLGARTVAAAVLIVAAAVAAAGSLAGAGLAYLLSFAINAYYRHLFQTDLVFSRVTWPLVADAAALSVVLGIGAGALTAWRLLRRRPLEQMGR